MTHEDPEVRWTSYVEAQVRIHHPTLGHLKIEPAPPGVAEGPFPAGENTVYIITGSNPGRLLSDVQNAERHELLRAAVLKAGPAEVWDAEGGDASWTHVEASFAVRGISLDQALSIARSFEQEAIFIWSRDSWTVRDCNSGRASHAGWRARSFPDPATRVIARL
jgi:hypothetical protein